VQSNPKKRLQSNPRKNRNSIQSHGKFRFIAKRQQPKPQDPLWPLKERNDHKKNQENTRLTLQPLSGM